jgi:pimeloyl-ACP methyl ester carboxylesterase
VDFPGSGGSEGNQTTIGYKEATVVKDCYQYLQEQGEKNIYLFGTSMGAVAVLKAVHDYSIHPAGLILECPFGTMYQTTVSRFHTMHVPELPFAPLLVFWGGVQNGFWAFSHNPVTYAKKVQCPALLMYGRQDEKVSLQETQAIYQNFMGAKYLITFEKAGHENYLARYKDQWITSVSNFMASPIEPSVK